MSFIELLLIAIGLSMDAFAVSICKGLAMPKIQAKSAIIIGLWFGGFQALMPLIGYLLGVQFQAKITAIDHWIAFVLLILIGGNMIREALGKDDEEETTADIRIKTMFVLAVATSIDALAVGLTFAMTNTNAFLPSCLIGVVCAAISACGLFLGKKLSSLPMLNGWAEVLGGVVLLCIGLNILHESGVI